jgi:hypothetical protein
MAAIGSDTKKFLPGQGKFSSIIKIPFCAMSGVIPLLGDSARDQVVLKMVIWERCAPIMAALGGS